MILREATAQLLVTVGDTLMVIPLLVIHTTSLIPLQIYRLYRIWGRNIYITIVPIFLLIAQTVTSYLAIVLLGLGQFTKLSTLGTLVLALNTAVQIVLAVLIAVRLLDPKDIKYLQKEQRSRRFQLVRCLVESGLLLAIALVIDLILLVQHVFFHWVFTISIPQLYAITTVLIVLRMDTFIDRQPSALSGSSHSGAQQTNYSRGAHPSNVRSPLSVILYNEPTLPGMDDAHKSQIGDPQYGIELQGYDVERRDMKSTDVYVEREVHHGV
jgi:hypothetical protein